MLVNLQTDRGRAPPVRRSWTIERDPYQFRLLGSFLFPACCSISAIIAFGFHRKRVATRWCCWHGCGLGAGRQFPMSGTVFSPRSYLAGSSSVAGEGPAFAVARTVYNVSRQKRTLPTAILSQGSAFGVLAVPAELLIVTHSCIMLSARSGNLRLMWVVAWRFMARGTLIQTVAMAAADPQIPYFHLLTSRTASAAAPPPFGA